MPPSDSVGPLGRNRPVTALRACPTNDDCWAEAAIRDARLAKFPSEVQGFMDRRAEPRVSAAGRLGLFSSYSPPGEYPGGPQSPMPYLLAGLPFVWRRNRCWRLGNKGGPDHRTRCHDLRLVWSRRQGGLTVVITGRASFQVAGRKFLFRSCCRLAMCDSAERKRANGEHWSPRCATKGLEFHSGHPVVLDNAACALHQYSLGADGDRMNRGLAEKRLRDCPMPWAGRTLPY